MPLPSPCFGSTSTKNSDPVAKQNIAQSSWLRPASKLQHSFPGITGSINIRCHVCRVNCSSQDDYDSHIEEHVPCSFGGCDFEANFKVVLDHQINVHMNLGGSSSKNRKLQSTGCPQVELLYGYYHEIVEQDFQTWRQERRKNYPRLPGRETSKDMSVKHETKAELEKASQSNDGSRSSLEDGEIVDDIADVPAMEVLTAKLQERQLDIKKASDVKTMKGAKKQCRQEKKNQRKSKFNNYSNRSRSRNSNILLRGSEKRPTLFDKLMQQQIHNDAQKDK